MAHDVNDLRPFHRLRLRRWVVVDYACAWPRLQLDRLAWWWLKRRGILD